MPPRRYPRQPLGITYLHADAAGSMVLDRQRFDGVACNYGLTDIDDLNGLLTSIAADWEQRLPGAALVPLYLVARCHR